MCFKVSWFPANNNLTLAQYRTMMRKKKKKRKKRRRKMKRRRMKTKERWGRKARTVTREAEMATRLTKETTQRFD